MSIEILETSPLYQRLVREATDKGLSQGIEQGLHDAALVALRGRLGDVSPELAQALAGASREAILDLLAHIASDSPEQIRARLGL